MDSTVRLSRVAALALVALIGTATVSFGSIADAAGNRHASAQGPAGLQIRFAGSSGGVLKAPPYVRPMVRGRLTGEGQSARAAVTVLQASPGEGFQLVRTLMTTNHGTFSLRLPPGGSRLIAATSGALTSNLLLEVEAVWIRLAVDRHSVSAGESVRFAGTLPNTRTARLLVALQVRRPQGYRTFDLLRTDPDGNFTGSFKLTIPGAHYRFRALVPTQIGLAVAPGTSNAVEVAVS